VLGVRRAKFAASPALKKRNPCPWLRCDIRLGHPRFDPMTMGNTFAGLIGGLAVFSRALSDDKIARLHEAIAL
jgi:hypothetical protein